MTLDRKEREERERSAPELRTGSDHHMLCAWLREAHQRIEELEAQVVQSFNDGVADASVNVLSQTRYWQKRAEDYRKTAIILRNELRAALCIPCGEVGCDGWVPMSLCIPCGEVGCDGWVPMSRDHVRCWRHR